MVHWRSKPLIASFLLASVLALVSSIIYSGRLTNSILSIELVHQGAIDAPRTSRNSSWSSASASASPMLPPSSRDKMLLNTPFYVYEDLFWHNATMTMLAMKHPSDRPVSKFLVTVYKEFKHSDDYWFAKNSRIHPMRTHNPAEAKLFVVPILQNTFDLTIMKRKYRLCWNSMCGMQLLEHAAKVLQESPWFRQYPHRHVMVASHFVYRERGDNPRFDAWNDKKPALFMEAQSRMNVISFEGTKTGRRLDNIALPSTYVGRACPLSEEKSQDVVMIASIRERSISFKDRAHICEWLANSNTSSTPNHRNVRFKYCGSGSFRGKVTKHGQGVAQCPALAQAKFGFHARGDTFGSNRLLDTILSGTVPIFTRKEHYDILPSWIDWEKMSYFIDMEDIDETGFMEKLQTILRDETGYQRRHRAVLANRQLFDWTSLHPFDMYMYAVQANLYPETRHTSSDWSVLKISPP